jgi:hypothetical protein
MKSTLKSCKRFVRLIPYIKMCSYAQHQWFMPLIPATQEVEIRRIEV